MKRKLLQSAAMFFYPLRTKAFPKMEISRSVLECIQREIGNRPPETGGMLGASGDIERITHFYFDRSAETSGGSYSPDNELLNRLLDEEWNPAGVRLVGFIHSHPWGCAKPSDGDVAYAERILACNPHLQHLFLPIVMVQDAGRFEVLPFIAMNGSKKTRIERAELVVVDDVPAAEAALVALTKPLPVEATLAVALAPEVAAETHLTKRLLAAQPLPGPRVTFGFEGAPLAETFRRVGTAYDLARLSTSRIIVAGVGGAASFVEDMVRTGVGEIVIIDPDTVMEANLATQHYRRAEIDRPKVACLAERLRDINPQAVVIDQQRRLDDIADEEFAKLAFAPLRAWTIPAKDLWGIPGLDVPVEVGIKPTVTLLCGLTDSFTAQSRINRLGLNFELATLCAQVYEKGRGAEITFTHPDVTPACHRCILSSRYRAYLEEDFQNTVTAEDCPLYATTRLNSLKTAMALAILHHGSDHPRWGSLLTRIGNRNLIQIRMDPNGSLPVFDRVFAGGDQERILFDEPVWLPQEPECPANGGVACPDCGGTGNLQAVKGTFGDTRIMRK